MAIVANRTFVYAVLAFVDDDLTQVPKFRELHKQGVFSYPEYCTIVDTIVSNHRDHVDTEGSEWWEEYNDANTRWDAAAIEGEDYKPGLSAAWDEADRDLSALFDRHDAECLERCGESELAHLFREHRVAYKALVDQGDDSFTKAPEVIGQVGCIYGDEKYTMIRAELDRSGRVLRYYA